MAVTKKHLKNVLGKFRAVQIKFDDDKYVAKVLGKGLSANDFSTAYKNKLDGVEHGAQVNIIETVKVNGADLANSDKSVNINLPYVAREQGGVIFYDGDGSAVLRIPIL